ncbi:hypothetical protein CMI44_01610 [Candidatus Pacearchaeota archaeon]|nr:hypothetical protein [Candidatus Pacearchaeota archaeon]
MSLENLTRYESAAVARMKEKENPMISLTAMTDFYNTLEMDEDYFVQEGLKKAQESLIHAAQTGREPTLANTGLLKAITDYSDKYINAFTEEKISGLVGYLEGSCSLPEQAKRGLLEYGELTYNELVDKSKAEDTSDETKKKIENALRLVLDLKDLKLEKSYVGMKTKNVERMANSFYP